MYNIFRITFIAAILCAGSLLLPRQEAVAGARINMPYSMFGVGELRFNNYFQNLGGGGLSLGYKSNMSINDVNPASYSGFDRQSFVFETTLFSHFYEQKTQNFEQQSDFLSLGHISFGFPVTSWWSFAAGLKPYSSVGYQIRDARQEEAGSVHYIYEGSGGLNQVFLGSAFEFMPGFSAGVNMSYIFGDVNNETSVLSDSVGVYRTNLINTDRVKGWLMGVGLQYTHEISSERDITFGVTAGNQTDATVNRSETLRRSLPGVLDYDTISYRELDEGTLTLPAYWGAGFFAKINPSWSTGMDFQWQNWESYEIMGEQEDFNNSYQFAAGVEFTPTRETYTNIFRRIRYSAGLRYGQAHFQPDPDPLNEFGISFGLNIPVRRTFNGVTIGFEYSRRGSDDSHLMQEDFYRLNVGINIYEQWFIRRRFY